MSKATVNVGAAPDDGTGDTLRAAFVKVQANFDELYNLLSGSIVVGAGAGGAPLTYSNLTYSEASGPRLTVGGSTAAAGITITGGTITANSNPLLITSTRNAAGVTFDGALKIVLTDTASAAGSLAMQILGGSTGTHIGFQVNKLGILSGAGMGTLSGYGLLLSGDTTSPTSYTVRITSVGVAYFLSSGSSITGMWNGVANNSQWKLDDKGSFSWTGSNNDATAAMDTNLSRISAGLVGVGTGAQGSFAGRLKLTSVIASGVTFANVNASPTAGEIQYVTDSSTATWGATIAGGGANKVLAWYNGTNWTVVGA